MYKTFEDTVAQHLKALREKNFPDFLETIGQDDTITLVLPNGKLLTTTQEVIELNRDWFLDEDWSMHTNTIRQAKSADMGYALIHVDYTDVDRAGKPLHKKYFLNLIFQRLDDRWLLVHDQNTDITSSTE